MPKTSVVSMRMEESQEERLEKMAQRLGRSPSETGALLVEEGLRLVQEIFQQGHDNGELSSADPELSALMLLGGLRAVVRFGRQPRPGNLAQRIVDGFLHGAHGARSLPLHAGNINLARNVNP